MEAIASRVEAIATATSNKKLLVAVSLAAELFDVNDHRELCYSSTQPFANC